MLRTRILRTWWLLVGTLLATQTAWGQEPATSNAIESLEVSSQSGKVVVRMSLAQPIADEPVSFTLSNPPRIALDFADTSNALGRNVQDIGQGELRSIRLGQSGGRTRVIFSMASMVGYVTQVQGRTI